MKNFWIFCIATVFLACESNDISLKSNPINSTIIIEAREELGPDTRRLTLFCKTGKTYPCINFPILTEWTKDESAVEVTFTAVGETVVCLTAIGPATTLVDLDGLSNGEYAIELNNANLKNKGTLKVTDTDISLLFDKKNGIDFVRSNTKRVPDNTYWGTIGYHDESSSTLVDEFVQKFSDAGAVFSAQTPGHYFYYEIDGSGAIVADAENSGSKFMEAFIFQYDGDESALRELVQVEGKKYKEALVIRLETFNGEALVNY